MQLRRGRGRSSKWSQRTRPGVRKSQESGGNCYHHCSLWGGHSLSALSMSPLDWFLSFGGYMTYRDAVRLLAKWCLCINYKGCLFSEILYYHLLWDCIKYTQISEDHKCKYCPCHHHPELFREVLTHLSIVAAKMSGTLASPYPQKQPVRRTNILESKSPVRKEVHFKSGVCLSGLHSTRAKAHEY